MITPTELVAGLGAADAGEVAAVAPGAIPDMTSWRYDSRLGDHARVSEVQAAAWIAHRCALGASGARAHCVDNPALAGLCAQIRPSSVMTSMATCSVTQGSEQSFSKSKAPAGRRYHQYLPFRFHLKLRLLSCSLSS